MCSYLKGLGINSTNRKIININSEGKDTFYIDELYAVINIINKAYDKNQLKISNFANVWI